MLAAHDVINEHDKFVAKSGECGAKNVHLSWVGLKFDLTVRGGRRHEQLAQRCQMHCFVDSECRVAEVTLRNILLRLVALENVVDLQFGCSRCQQTGRRQEFDGAKARHFDLLLDLPRPVRASTEVDAGWRCHDENRRVSAEYEVNYVCASRQREFTVPQAVLLPESDLRTITALKETS